MKPDKKILLEILGEGLVKIIYTIAFVYAGYSLLSHFIPFDGDGGLPMDVYTWLLIAASSIIYAVFTISRRYFYNLLTNDYCERAPLLEGVFENCAEEDKEEIVNILFETEEPVTDKAVLAYRDKNGKLYLELHPKTDYPDFIKENEE